jgi:RNA polymerase sigma factor (sigma-70 family)
MTDKELEQIYNEAYKAVYWTAMALLKNEADAEDIVQDTFVSLIESYDSIEDKSKVTAWLKKNAANKCLNRLTRTKTDNVEDGFFDSVEAVPEDFLPDSIVESEDTRKIIMDIINNVLSDDVRRTLILFYFDEMSTKEIAEALKIPQGTVLWRLNFAKKKIKKEVEKYEEENDTKLYGMAIPFLTKLFAKEAEKVAFKPLPASLSNLSASTEASKAGTNLAKSAVKKGTDIMKTKILIGTIAGVVAVGATIGIIIGVIAKNKDKKPSKTRDTFIE